MHINKNSADCCGCSACASKCSKQAIHMEADEFGFLYPVIDEDVCIHCGVCIRVCKFQEGHVLHPLLAVYGARLKDEGALVKSQSGAAFWAFGCHVIRGSGVVYGAAMLDDWSVSHIRVTTLAEMERLRTSKYVQSEIRDSYKSALHDLRDGLTVLFTGTPCQIVGLYSFLGRDYDNLFTISLVCHGVPSPRVWHDYRDRTESITGRKVKSFKFRDKSYGWHSHMETFTFSDGSQVSGRIFRDLFYSHLILRDSCHSCPYTSLARVSDVSIGDFWGWENFSSEFNDNLGVSLVLLNTEKGKAICDLAKAMLELRVASQESCMQPQLISATTPPLIKERFKQDYVSKGFQYVIYRYGFTGLSYYWNLALEACKLFVHKVEWHINKRLK